VALRFSRSHPQARFPALPDFTGSGSPRPRFPALPGFSHLLLHYRPHLRAPGLTAPLSHPVSMLYLVSPAPVPRPAGPPGLLAAAVPCNNLRTFAWFNFQRPPQKGNPLHPSQNTDSFPGNTERLYPPQPPEILFPILFPRFAILT
jgi:hypothetical protein